MALVQCLPYALVDESSGCQPECGDCNGQYVCVPGMPGGLPVPGTTVCFGGGSNGPSVACASPVFPPIE
jgi:hypothetical protein